MQLRKAIGRTIRDCFPCSRCGMEHKTREHGKSAKLIAAEERSRERNPQDLANKLGCICDRTNGSGCHCGAYGTD